MRCTNPFQNLPSASAAVCGRLRGGLGSLSASSCGAFLARIPIAVRNRDKRAPLLIGRSRVFVVTTPAEEYRTQARECAERAKLARDPETKRQYEDMARQWLELAKRAEKLG